MLVEMKIKNNPTTLAAVQKFERQRDLYLPDSFKAFLILTNGGVPVRPAFPINGWDNNPIGVVQAFAGIGVSEPTDELAYAYDLYRGGLPKGIVPFAGNGGGDYVCLDLRNGGEKVVFWDKRHFWGTGEWREIDLYHVADTFDEFLALLKPNPY